MSTNTQVCIFFGKKSHQEGRLAPNWPPDFCHLGAETCAAPWCPCPHGSLLIGGGMPAVPLSGLPGSAVPTEEAPGLSCRHPEPETKRPQKSGNPPFWATPIMDAWMKFFTNTVRRGNIGSGVFFISLAIMCKIEIHGCVFVSSPSGDHPFIGMQALYDCGRKIFEIVTPAQTLTTFGSIMSTQGKITFRTYSHQSASLWS